MQVEPILPWLLTVLLLTVRLTTAVALSPVLSAYGVPATVRVALTFALATLSLAGRPAAAGAVSWLEDPIRLVVPLLAEFAIGALLGLSVQIVLGAFAVAGRLMDVQIGFGIASIFDPTTRTGASVLGMLLSLVGVMLFIAADAHLELAHLVATSVDVFPLGQVPALDNPMRAMGAAGAMFTLGLTLAAPLAVVLLLIDAALGVLSRTMPQLNILVLGMPLKVAVGYVVVACALPLYAQFANSIFSRVARTMGIL